MPTIDSDDDEDKELSKVKLKVKIFLGIFHSIYFIATIVLGACLIYGGVTKAADCVGDTLPQVMGSLLMISGFFHLAWPFFFTGKMQTGTFYWPKHAKGEDFGLLIFGVIGIVLSIVTWIGIAWMTYLYYPASDCRFFNTDETDFFIFEVGLLGYWIYFAVGFLHTFCLSPLVMRKHWLSSWLSLIVVSLSVAVAILLLLLIILALGLVCKGAGGGGGNCGGGCCSGSTEKSSKEVKK